MSANLIEFSLLQLWTQRCVEPRDYLGESDVREKPLETGIHRGFDLQGIS